MRIEKFVPISFGWVSEKTPPQNHNNVVILGYDKENDLYYEFIGYYEYDDWIINDSFKEFEVKGWFPFPYTPHNH
jgi:hypothetical protein